MILSKSLARVGFTISLHFFLFLLSIGVKPVSAANLVYFHEGRGTTARGIYDYDTENEVSTFRTTVPIGSNNFPRLFSFEVRRPDGILFAIDEGGHRLYTVDPNTGGLINIWGPINGLILSNLAYDPHSNRFFSMKFDIATLSRTLISIDPQSGNATDVGDLGLNGYGSSAIEFLDDGSLILYEDVLRATTTSFGDGRLYKVNPETAELSLIGETQGINTLVDFAHIGDRLFATSFGYGGTFLWEIDVATGQPTPLNAPASDNGYGGLVALAPIPEPSTLHVLCGVGAILTILRLTTVTSKWKCM